MPYYRLPQFSHNRARVLVVLYFLSALFEAVTLFLILFFLRPSAGPFILHFDPFVGINVMGTIGAIYRLYLTSIFLVVLNFVLASFLARRAPFFGHLLAATALLIAILIFIYIGVIISVN
jgi:hypothetical protein